MKDFFRSAVQTAINFILFPLTEKLQNSVAGRIICYHKSLVCLRKSLYLFSPVHSEERHDKNKTQLLLYT